MAKTIDELGREYGGGAAAPLLGGPEQLWGLRDLKLPEGLYLDELDARQRRALLDKERRKRAGELYEHTLKEYKQAAEDYRERVNARKAALKKRLFGSEGGEDLAALSSAAA